MGCLILRAESSLKGSKHVSSVSRETRVETHDNVVQREDIFSWEPQSSPAPITGTVHSDNSMHTALVNRDDVMGNGEGSSGHADIQKFLERPVQIHTSVWANAASFSATINPWYDYLNNTAVKNKLENYNLFKGDLMLTVYVNGTPFHVGMLLASYLYLDQNRAKVTIGGDTQFVTYSQRPHIFLNVATNKSGCLCVPFFYPYNYLNLTFNSAGYSATQMGTLHIGSFAPLAQINGGTDAVTVTVYAQLMNVVLTGPTAKAVALSGPATLFNYFNYEAQAKKGKLVRQKNIEEDEYGDEKGVISAPASTIAQYAGYLIDAPIVGPFALATQMGASAVSNIAKLFGYGRPPIIDPIGRMRPFPISSLALSDMPETVQKLTLTSKQEVSIDPRLTGLSGEVDEMDLKFWTSRWSYLTQFTWDPADAVSSYIFSCQVMPMLQRETAAVSGYEIIPTALSYISNLFTEWCGSMKFRFQVIASQMHRGRLAIIYDPSGNISSDPFNTTFNVIIDLEEGRDFTVEFNWQSQRPFLRVENSRGTTLWTETVPEALAINRGKANGVFFVRVVNELVVPDGTTPAKVLVSVCGGDDFMLQNPSNYMKNVSPYVPLSGKASLFSYFDYEAQSSAAEVTPKEENSPVASPEELVVTTGVESKVLERPFVTYGEVPTHLRQLVKRYVPMRYLSDQTNTGRYSDTWLFPTIVPSYGYSTQGIDMAGLNPCNFTGVNHINYLKEAYAAWKGSIRWKFVPMTSDVDYIYCERRTTPGDIQGAITYSPYTAYTPTGQTQENIAKNMMDAVDSGGSGSALTTTRTSAVLELEIPYQLPLKFSSTGNTIEASGDNTWKNAYPAGSALALNVVSSTIENTVIACYQAAGEDFSFFAFTGAPVYWDYPRPSPAT